MSITERYPVQHCIWKGLLFKVELLLFTPLQYHLFYAVQGIEYTETNIEG